MRGHLPDENPGFVGRRTELERVSAALAEHRLVTVTGVGGVGKTRLALRAAHRAADRHPDGAWWADLGQLDGERLLVPLVADAVDLADHATGTAAAGLRRRLADTRLLLVLDSCEHLAEPCARLVAELLAAAPGLTVLATSRRPLGIEGERIIALDPLPPAGRDALELLREASGERFPAAGPASEICVRLEGIPLALELAAAQIRLQGAEAVREQLGTRIDAPASARFDLLAHPERVWPSRHQTLRAAIGWSHELSSPLERLLWARLSVFRGPFDLASATAVCVGGPLDDTTLPAALDGLVRASVVRPPDAAGRHRMLDTIRAYGATWLDHTGGTGAVADRHAAHFRGLARRAETAWHGPRQLRWYRTVDAHHTDLRTALDRLLRTDPDAALDLVGSVAFAWSCRGRLHESRDGLEQALLLSTARGRPRARALWALGITLVLQGEGEKAREISERCAREARYAEWTEHLEGTGRPTVRTGSTETGEPSGRHGDASAGYGDGPGRYGSTPEHHPGAYPGVDSGAHPGVGSGVNPGVDPGTDPDAHRGRVDGFRGRPDTHPGELREHPDRPGHPDGPGHPHGHDGPEQDHGPDLPQSRPDLPQPRDRPNRPRDPAGLHRPPRSHRPGELTLDAAALTGLLALTTGRPTAAHLVVGHVLDSAEAPAGAPEGAPTGPTTRPDHVSIATIAPTEAPDTAPDAPTEAPDVAPDTEHAPPVSAARLRCLLVRVFALTGLGRVAEAREEALALRALCEELDEHWTRTALEYHLALTGLLEGDPVGAAGHARAMLEGTRGLGAILGVALGLDVLATALAAAGDGARAADVSGTGEAYWRSTGQPRRGLPGLRALHEKYTDTARAALGAPAYEEIFGRALSGLPQDGLDRALRGPRPP
ncbi:MULTISPECIES: ATP-binding protein [unclassified Streptomyces]|uniref:ATP-binding protein n=1 Tax=unclassified Streptomyces TaxID=2593676 RepID=UPI002948C447|nr:MULTISPECIES: NB-ARC domain-containing protein [unclassified Streptomyces]